MAERGKPMTKADLKSLWYIKRKLQHGDTDEQETERLKHKVKRIETWISEIDDPLVKDIIEYRFVRGYRWAKVSVIVGGGNTEDGVRKIVERYLKR